MGVVGFTYDQIQTMPMDAVARAITARKKLIGDVLGAVFGKPDEETAGPDVSIQPLTPSLFKAVIMGTA